MVGEIRLNTISYSLGLSNSLFRSQAQGKAPRLNKSENQTYDECVPKHENVKPFKHKYQEFGCCYFFFAKSNEYLLASMTNKTF